MSNCSLMLYFFFVQALFSLSPFSTFWRVGEGGSCNRVLSALNCRSYIRHQSESRHTTMNNCRWAVKHAAIASGTCDCPRDKQEAAVSSSYTTAAHNKGVELPLFQLYNLTRQTSLNYFPFFLLFFRKSLFKIRHIVSDVPKKRLAKFHIIDAF